MLSDSTIHDLAVTYAQAKLIQAQQEHPEMNGTDKEIRLLLKAYDYARYQIPIEYEDFDEHF